MPIYGGAVSTRGVHKMLLSINNWLLNFDDQCLIMSRYSFGNLYISICPGFWTLMIDGDQCLDKVLELSTTSSLELLACGYFG